MNLVSCQGGERRVARRAGGIFAPNSSAGGTRPLPSAVAAEVLEGRVMLAVFVVTTAADSGPGSLRQAVIDAAATPAVPDEIHFDIAGPPEAARTIALASPLPAPLPLGLTIDGTTQPGYAGKPLIELNGSAAGDAADGLADPSLVRGLVVNRFSRHGIVLNGGRVEACYVGTTAAGDAPAGNGAAGVYVGRGSTVGAAGVLQVDPGLRNVISGNGAAGVWLAAGAGGTTIAGNYIGTDASGTLAVPNAAEGVRDKHQSGEVTIGGPSVAQRNLISGNLGSGVQIVGSAGRTFVRGNFIGTDGTGSVPLMNVGEGVEVIGVLPLGTGQRWVQGNLISGNGRNGIRMWGMNAFPEGNYVGTNAAGNAALPNGGDGIQAEDTVLSVGETGGPDVAAAVIDPAGTTRNIISGNRGNGIHGINLIPSDAGIVNNYVGTDVTGSVALGNGGDGMLFEGLGLSRIGYASRLPPGDPGNLVSANKGNGITLVGAAGIFGRTTISGNRIGTDASGGARNSTLGNLGNGIAVIDSRDIRIGNTEGATFNKGNTIAFNRASGVRVEGGTLADPARAAILRNSIYSNGRLGIDLVSPQDAGGTGVTPNDPRDSDRGPNHLQNFPEILGAVLTAGRTRVSVAATGEPNKLVRIEFFSSPEPDPSGFGEGRTYLGFIDASTGETGSVRVIRDLAAVRPGTFLTATATLNAQETSEFSSAVRVTGGLARRRAVYAELPTGPASELTSLRVGRAWEQVEAVKGLGA